MAHSPTSTSTRRLVRRVAVVVVLAAAGTAGYLATRPKEDAPVVAASIFKTATVEEGALGTSESLDGSVVLSAVTTVLHRIEGQTSSSVSTPSSSGNGGAPTAAGITSSAATSGASTIEAVSMVQGVSAVEAASDCSAPGSTDTTVPAGAGDSTTTTVAPPASIPDASTPDGSVPTETVPTQTAPATTAPVATEPSTTVATPPVDCTTTTTTAPAGGGAPTGGGFPSGSSGGTGGSSSTGGSSGSSSTRVTQVVTSVIADGSDVGMGTVLYSVESSPVVALAGSLPAWRTLDTSSDDGFDILQLEMDLTALGYDPDGTMTIDTEFDSDTKAVVKAWQEGYGMEVTGSVALGSVVFVNGETSVAGVDVAVGDEVGDGDRILSLSAASQQVVIDVPDGAEAYLVPGLVVNVGSGEGTVTLLRSVERDGSVVVQAVITPTAPIEGTDNGATIKVTVTTTSMDGVLLVPAEALVSRLDGSYALQVVQADGSAKFVDVELLGVSGSNVGVRGDGLAAGDEVLQPL